MINIPIFILTINSIKYKIKYKEVDMSGLDKFNIKAEDKPKLKWTIIIYFGK